MCGKWNGALFYLLVVIFHAELGSVIMVCVHLCMRACMYFITNCVFCYCCFSLVTEVCYLFVYWFSRDPTSAIFLHHRFHEFPIDIVQNIGRRDISYP